MIGRTVRSLRNRGRAVATRARVARVAALRMGGQLDGGHAARIGSRVRLEIYGELRLGARVRLDDGCSLHVSPGATLDLGDDVYVGRHTVVAAVTSVAVGPRTMIGESASVRDADHSLDPRERRREWTGEAAPTATPLRIGADVWIGAGARVLRGADVGDGAVVAANAVVRDAIPARHLAVGVPARVVRALDVDGSTRSTA